MTVADDDDSTEVVDVGSVDETEPVVLEEVEMPEGHLRAAIRHMRGKDV